MTLGFAMPFNATKRLNLAAGRKPRPTSTVVEGDIDMSWEATRGYQYTQRGAVARLAARAVKRLKGGKPADGKHAAEALLELPFILAVLRNARPYLRLPYLHALSRPFGPWVAVPFTHEGKAGKTVVADPNLPVFWREVWPQSHTLVVPISLGTLIDVARTASFQTVMEVSMSSTDEVFVEVYWNLEGGVEGSGGAGYSVQDPGPVVGGEGKAERKYGAKVGVDVKVKAVVGGKTGDKQTAREEGKVGRRKIDAVTKEWRVRHLIRDVAVFTPMKVWLQQEYGYVIADAQLGEEYGPFLPTYDASGATVKAAAIKYAAKMDELATAHAKIIHRTNASSRAR